MLEAAPALTAFPASIKAVSIPIGRAFPRRYSRQG
ncbi:MAG: hypothetical protein A4E73_00670 [Syntrophaceae bacterium PtaU1.Bin231]|nr:MAG: hypothetical protein A4E73_00670 [Syntrophaceae bacterium PtaU1.Bin231]